MRRVPAEWRKVQALVFSADGLTSKKVSAKAAKEKLSHTEKLERVDNVSRFAQTPPMEGRPEPPPVVAETPANAPSVSPPSDQQTTRPLSSFPPDDQRTTPRIGGSDLAKQKSTLPLGGR